MYLHLSALPVMALKFLQFLFIFMFSFQAKGDEFARTLKPQSLGFNKAEKLTHFHFYLHDTFSGSNPTTSPIIRPPSGLSPVGFGAVMMIADPSTEGTETNSKLVGRAQGFYGQASQTEIGLVMAMNIVFLEDEYNGSYITVLGRNKAFDKVREMPVVGGSVQVC